MKETRASVPGFKTAKRAAGFTLMEVLVAVVILSVGLLGVASLQFGSLRGNQSAFHNSIAAALAAEGADRIRANLPGVLGGDYNLIASAGSDPGCVTSACEPDEIAQHDAYEWITSIEALLPDGQGVLCRDFTPYDGTGSAAGENGCGDGKPNENDLDVFAVKIWWDHDRDSSTPRVAYRVSIVP